MPNNSYSVLKFHYHDDKGEKIKEIQAFLKSDKSELDFMKIIPLQTDSCEESRDKWGTKWNAYDVKLESIGDWKLVYTFQTAWSYPEPIIDKLLEIFPDVAMEFLAADDGGFFAVRYSKSENEPVVINLWRSESNNDPGGHIRAAIYESLNPTY